MGSSTAYHLLLADPGLAVAVIERDDQYERASTLLSVGNVRIQFNLEENILMSLHMLQVLRSFNTDLATADNQPEVAARHQGNLFLTDEQGRRLAWDGLELQRALGCEVDWLDMADIVERFPDLRARGLAGGTFGPQDGSVDPTAVLRGYRAKAIELGATYIEEEAAGIPIDGGRTRGVVLASGDVIDAGHVVAAAGAWTPGLLHGLGIELPVEPVMRTVYVVSTPFPAAGLPSVFQPSGVYALAESENTWLVGWSRPEDPVGYDFTPASREHFENLIWPALIEHLPAFEQLAVERSWAGMYAMNTLDGNGIIGQWPGIGGLYVAAGFSGHGFQQSPAVGRYLAEQILGMEHALDLERLSPQRIVDGRPVFETARRLI